MIKSYSLAEDDIDHILRLPEVIHAKGKIDRLSNNNGQIDFSIDIPASLKKQIGNKMGINLSRMETIPMRWIKGDTPSHSDCIKDFTKDVAKDFANTYLAYLTDSKGRFIVDGNVYAISKGNAHVFSEGLRHETSGTGSEPRLLLGPMSEDGTLVGVDAIPPPRPVREYDQILSGDVKIKKVSSDDYTHKITFSKKNISKVLMYQVWSDTSAKLNDNRIVKEVKATSWVKSAFRKVEDGSLDNLSRDCDTVRVAYDPVICSNRKKYPNAVIAGCAGQKNCAPFSDVPFTPTAVMELDDGECPHHHKASKHAECRHVFVIKRGLVNKCGQVVFYVSSEEIVLPTNPNQEVKRLKTIPIGSFRRTRFDIDAFGDEPPYPAPTKYDYECADTDISDQSVFFESTTNSASTITFKASTYLKDLSGIHGLNVEVLILPVNNSIGDIKYEWQQLPDRKWDLNPYVVLTDSTKQSVFGVSSYFQDGVGLNIGKNVLSSSEKAFITFTTYTSACVGRCYVSLK